MTGFCMPSLQMWVPDKGTWKEGPINHLMPQHGRLQKGLLVLSINCLLSRQPQPLL